MKMPEEIKKGLEHCTTDGADCTGCIYRDECMEEYDNAPIQRDALAYIKQLERENKDLLEERELNDYLRDKVQQLEAQVPKWISVKERLPEREYKVLTINGHGYIRIFALWKRNGREWCWINDAGHFSHTNDITHWMPLPEGPKEG